MRRAKLGDIVHMRGKRGRWKVLELIEDTYGPAHDQYRLKQEWPKGHETWAYRAQFRVLRGRNAANFKTTPKELLAALKPGRIRR